MMSNLHIVYLAVLLCAIPNLFAQADDVKGGIPGSSAIVGAVQGIAAGGGLTNVNRVAYCYTNTPCAKLCPARGRGILTGTYCFLGRCFCQKANLARAKDCQTPDDHDLVKACTLPPGFSMVHPTPATDAVTSDPSKMPEFDVCKMKGRMRGNYCVFYTDYSLGSGGVETQPDISQIPELAAKKKRPRRRPGHKGKGKGKAKGRRPKKPKRRHPKKPKKSANKNPGGSTTHRPKSIPDDVDITSTTHSYFD